MALEGVLPMSPRQAAQSKELRIIQSARKRFNKAAEAFGVEPEMDEAMYIGPDGYREIVKAARDKKDASDKKIADMLSRPVSAGTSSLLKKAWLNVIPSWGLTLIWVNIHVGLHYIFGERFFCKLGREWAPTALNKNLVTKKVSEKTGQALGIAESAGLTFVDLILFFAILLVLTFICLIIMPFLDPLGLIGKLLS